MYHYEGCGLPNVYLENGYELVDSPYGQGVVIHNLEGLHEAIGEAIVMNPVPLVGVELRFLRNQLELSQEALGKLLGRDQQSVARWEKGHSKKVDPSADRLMRVLYQGMAMGEKKLAPILKLLQIMDATPRSSARLVVRERKDEWHAKVAA